MIVFRHEESEQVNDVYIWMAVGAVIGLAIGFGFGTEGRIAGIALGAAVGLALHSLRGGGKG